MAKDISRRSFLKTGTAAAVGLTMAPDALFARKKKKETAPKNLDRKLKILGVGVGGRGFNDLKNMETEEIIGLCDVDWKYADRVFKHYPNAKKYKDWRVMFKELLPEADAVMIATSDHTHAIIAANAIMAGKHVYCEKPLTRTVYESRLLTKLAAKYGVATQMGNQGASAEGVRKVYEEILVPAGMGDVKIYTEMGRFMLAPYGVVVTKAIHEKHIYKEYIGVDACAVNLMRPAIYGAYHHITVLGKENAPCDHVYDVTGSLCENNDKFAIDRKLPKIDMGDILVIHDTGAHGFAMGYNYNGKLKSAELLLREDGSVIEIRRPETVDDYFATLDGYWNVIE